MAQPEKYPIALSKEKFFKEFNISAESFRIYQYTKSNNYGWCAEIPNQMDLSGPVSAKFIESIKQHKDVNRAFVRYYWDSDGNLLKTPVWVLQIRPNDSQLSNEYALVMLLQLLNQKKQELYGDKAVLYKLSDLKKHLQHCKQEGCYHEFSIPKKNGKLRKISAPNHDLKGLQGIINLILQEKYLPTAAAMGFVPGRSVADNARTHQRQNYVYNIDIKDFFPSISSRRVYAMLQLPPYSFDKTTASILADLCCYKGVLPQGAPSSPILTNIICERLDWRLSKLARRFNLKSTRYADDITFSGMENVFHADGEFVERLQHYIAKEGFTINPEKTRLNSIGGRQEVTGLTVNAKANVSKHYIKTLRTMLHNWETLGIDEAQKRMAAEYGKDKRKVIKGTPHIENVIQGKLNYLKMIKGNGDSTYKKLLARYDSLMEKDFGIQDILDLWEKQGYERAAQVYIEHFATRKPSDKQIMTLADFEELTGKKVVFMPKSQISNLQDSSITHKGNPFKEPESSLFSNSFKIRGNPNRIVPTIDGQQYLGDIKLECKSINTQQDIFVSYIIYQGRKCFFFSNSNSLPCENTNNRNRGGIYFTNMDDSAKEELLKMIMWHKCSSFEYRRKRANLMFKEIQPPIKPKDEIPEEDLYKVSELLSAYNQDEILRYTCHLIDKSDAIDIINNKCKTQKYDYEKHIEAIIKSWKRLSKIYIKDEATKHIRGIINAYLTGEEPWSSNSIHISWSSPEVKQWAKEHPHIIVSPGENIAKEQHHVRYNIYPPFFSIFTGVRIATFSELVLYFKTFFHVKPGNLENYIKYRYEKIWNEGEKYSPVNISYNLSKTIELFTDVDKLMQACDVIIEMAHEAYSKRPELGVPQIAFSLVEDVDKGMAEFIIHHINSVYLKGFNSMNRIGETQNRLKKLLFGMCSIIIQADCGEGHYGELNLLDGNPPSAKQIAEVTGVKYILKFKQ